MSDLRDLGPILDPTMPFSVNNDGIFVVVVGGEKLGLPVSCVQTIFRIDRVTPVPGAPREVIGLVNLRGHIVTAASLRRRLGMADGPVIANPLTIGIEHHGENFALVVDEVGDVINISRAERIQAPPHLNATRLGLTAAVYKVEAGIICVLDMSAVFEFSRRGSQNGPALKDHASEYAS
jgi:purine-binding chemotaxis protein CheW